MELINNLIIAVDEAGLRDNAYTTINMIAFAISCIFGFLNGIKLKTGVIAVAITVFAERALSGQVANAILFIEDGFVRTGRANNVVAFAFVPLIGFLVAKILKKSYKEIWDIIMVAPIVMLAGARIACTVTGCCYGYSCSWGVYNADMNEKLFPIQLLESLVAILIIVYVIYREKKNDFVPDGMNVPIILILYGVLRFFLEFLHDNEKIIFGLASTQFHCIVMIIVGIITLMIIRKSEKTVENKPNNSGC